MTATSNSLYTKFGLKTSTISENKGSQFCFIHDLMVKPQPYKGRDSLLTMQKQKNQVEEYLHYTNPKTSFYLCKRYQPSTQFEKLPRYLIKRLAYRKTNETDKWGRVIYNDAATKNIDQVSTQFHCLNLLKDSHRAIQMQSLLHENVDSKDDKKFFYHHLRLPDRRSKGIRNICFILEEMNEGSLREQLQKVIEKKEPFCEEKIVEYACQFAEGLLELRSKGIIHRDLRPDNVLVHNGQLKFADFDSAFIKGYSDYRNIKNGVDMKETTPLQIMLLIAQSEEKLKNFSSEDLYQKQEKADVYFLGVNIYSMIFSQMFQSFNGGQVLKNLINIKKRSGFCAKLLDLMERCLQKDVHVRIDLEEVIKILSEIEKEFYFNSQTYKRVYLGDEPLNLKSFSSNQIQNTIKPLEIILLEQTSNSRKQMDDIMKEAVRISTVERNTHLYEHLFKKTIEEIKSNQIWLQTPKIKLIQVNQQNLLQRIQTFLERLQIKAYYYELAYRILCQVNLGEVKSSVHFENIRIHIELFSSQLVVVLTFIYNTILKCSFTSDSNFQHSNPSYQLRRVFENIRNLHSRWEFFSGRLQLQNQANSMRKKLKKKIEEAKITSQGDDFKELQQLEQSLKITFKGITIVQSLQQTLQSLKTKEYSNQEERLSFMSEERYLMKYLDKVESIVKKEMIQTIISLILAYQKIKTESWGYRCNLKNAIFMLMILDAQNTKTVEKNDLVIIKGELTTMINMKLGWKSEELEAFFINYTSIHTQEVLQGLCELQSQAIILSQKSVLIDNEDFCIQINAPGSNEEIEKKLSGKYENNRDSFMEQDSAEPSNITFNNNVDPSDKIVEASEIKESNVRETFDFKLYQSKVEEMPTPIKKQNLPEAELTLEIYD